MKDPDQQNEIKQIAYNILAEIEDLPVKNTPTLRNLRRSFSQKLRDAYPAFVLDLAKEILRISDHGWLAYELIHDHKAAFESLTEVDIEELGKGINSWWTVDSFARTLSGPAWRKGLVSDDLMYRWAKSNDLWWRRGALVSTVALNISTYEGHGDTARTLRICRLLAADHEDMVVKGLSWALRELVPHDPDAVESFLKEFEHVLASRVKREVRNKLTTGLKNPPKQRR